MYTKKLALIVFGIAVGLTVLLSGRFYTTKSVAVYDTPKPQDVVERFYTWYLQYARETGNPLIDKAYRSSESLSETFVEKVDETLAGFDRSGYDPFLCAQDVPARFAISDTVVVSGKEATVIVEAVWNPGIEFESLNELVVILQPIDGDWKITDVNCTLPEAMVPLPEGPVITTPEGAVAAFYSWYLWYAQEAGNPLIDRAYRSSEYLSEGLIQKADAIVDAFDHGGFDPFLCAQDVPESFDVEDTVISGDIARTIVHTSWEGHSFTVALRRIGERWEMTDVLCEVE